MKNMKKYQGTKETRIINNNNRLTFCEQYKKKIIVGNQWSLILERYHLQIKP